MMILNADIPEGIEINAVEGKTALGFEASFDFYDAVLGIAVFTDIKKAASGIWVRQQIGGADEPSPEWAEFFIQKLFESIGPDGSYGVPVCSFVNDDCDLTVVPAKQEDTENRKPAF